MWLLIQSSCCLLYERKHTTASDVLLTTSVKEVATQHVNTLVYYLKPSTMFEF